MISEPNPDLPLQYGAERFRPLPHHLFAADTVVQKVARATALALNNSAIRQLVWDAFKASAFREGKVSLQRFLSAPASASLLDEIAAQLRLTPDSAISVLQHLPEMEFYAPVDHQRRALQLEGEYIVVGTAFRDSHFRRAGRTKIGAWSGDGQKTEVLLARIPESTLISIVPAEQDFSFQPVLASEECDPETAIIPCPEDPGDGGISTYTGMYIDVLAHRYSAWSYDDVPFGDPEFEVYLAEQDPVTHVYNSPTDAEGHAPCAGDAHPVSARHFDYNDPPSVYNSDFLVAEGTASWLALRYGGGTGGDGYVHVVFSENDDTGCPSQGEPSLAEFNNGTTGSNDDDMLGIIGFQMGAALPWSFTNPYSGGDPGMFTLDYAENRTY